MVSEEDVRRAINSTIELGNCLKKIKGGPFPTDLLSTFGELKVFLELKKQFPKCEVRFKRKARADISIDSVNIEVKTSNLKKEEYGEGYGFALHVKKCKEHPEAFVEHPRRGQIKGDFCYFNYLICVAVNDQYLENPIFYIFSRDELISVKDKIRNKSKRFWFSPYRILVPIKPNPEQKGIIYNDFDLKLASDDNEYKNRWDKIKCTKAV